MEALGAMQVWLGILFWFVTPCWKCCWKCWLTSYEGRYKVIHI